MTRAKRGIRNRHRYVNGRKDGKRDRKIICCHYGRMESLLSEGPAFCLSQALEGILPALTLFWKCRELSRAALV